MLKKLNKIRGGFGSRAVGVILNMSHTTIPGLASSRCKRAPADSADWEAEAIHSSERLAPNVTGRRRDDCFYHDPTNSGWLSPTDTIQA
jgi:hypothetical protein